MSMTQLAEGDDALRDVEQKGRAVAARRGKGEGVVAMGQPAAAPRRHDRLRIRPHEADQTGLDGALRVGRDRPEMVAVATGDVADAGFPCPGYGLGRAPAADHGAERSEEHTSDLQSL